MVQEGSWWGPGDTQARAEAGVLAGRGWRGHPEPRGSQAHFLSAQTPPNLPRLEKQALVSPLVIGWAQAFCLSRGDEAPALAHPSEAQSRWRVPEATPCWPRPSLVESEPESRSRLCPAKPCGLGHGSFSSVPNAFASNVDINTRDLAGGAQHRQTLCYVYMYIYFIHTYSLL